jgi:hypothetical protein
MHPFKKFVLGIAVVGLVAGVGACGDDDDTSPCETASVTVTPGVATIDVGGTQQLAAAALDASGNACGTLAWSTSDAAVATVSSVGLVTGVSGGTADITATAGAFDGVSTITVNPANAGPTIGMTTPAGGGAVLPGSVLTIAWTATDDNAVTGVDLSYTADGVLEPVSIAVDVQGMTYDWTTPSETLYGVLVKGVAKDAEGLTAEDETTDIFAVVQFSARGYVQGLTCGECHENYFTEVYSMSGHPYKLNKVEGGVAPTYPNGPGVPNPPAPMTWADVSYVIGGYGWKARFIGTEAFNQGYIYTPAAGQNQWNLMPPPPWSDYHPGELKPYDCGTCHTTGWQSVDDNGGVHQDGLTGFLGTFEEQGVTCEQCHTDPATGLGGATHVSTQSADDITVDASSDLCGTCHQRGGADSHIEASGGWIRHHEQFNEFSNSVHFGAGVGCNDCHDPHLGTRYDMGGFIASCTTCHADEAANFNHLEVFPAGDEKCITCHMSQATKSAVADATNPNFVGDVKTHIFTINPGEFNKDYFFSADGSLVETAAEGVTLDFVCYQCHTDPVTLTGGGMSQKTLAELSAKATGIHTP